MIKRDEFMYDAEYGLHFHHTLPVAISLGADLS
jgi:hypothetical protein